jgi:DNA helicase II / ATP-dependent DNA helicase PcrA
MIDSVVQAKLSRNEPALLEDQQKIVDRLNGGVLVLAPVGTGKTRVLAERLAKAIAVGGFAPERILNLTFTNRAAQEMRNRVRRYLPDEAPRLIVKTFHALCAYVLRFEAKQIGLDPDFVVFDDADSEELIRHTWAITGNDKTANGRLSEISNALHDCKAKADTTRLRVGLMSKHLFDEMGSEFADRAVRYQNLLAENNALDFADLTYLARSSFQEDTAIADRWRARFDFVQVDEVQDTHMSEYEIVRHLARQSGNLAMIGDVDQTIYEWRGSTPTKVLEQFKSDFSAYELQLSLNHRATKTLINAASSFAASYANRRTKCVAAPDRPDGEPILVHHAHDENQEGDWVAQQIARLRRGNPELKLRRVAVLTRRNSRSICISKALENAGIACVTIDQFDFFRRQEVKDALAYVRLLLNPHDSTAVRRVLKRPGHGIGDAIISAVDSVRDAGLRLSDMLDRDSLNEGDPFSELMEGLRTGSVVIIDTETTGLSPAKDEVVELAAVKLLNGKVVDELHQFIRPTIPLGESEMVHGISADFLAQNGLPARQVLSECAEFIRGSVVVGHNVGFDIKMLEGHAGKVGVELDINRVFDTLDLARRFVTLENRKLGTLADHFQIQDKPTHRAIDDAHTTEALLGHLADLAGSGMAGRRSVVANHGKAFTDIAAKFSAWRQFLTQLRPGQLLRHVLDDSGLRRYYARELKRAANLDLLCAYFDEKDKGHLETVSPEIALREIVEFTALARQMIEYELSADDRVPIITVHQSKGLEFDHVFLPGVVEYEMPDFRNNTGGKLEEEKRVFYVALTRAKQRLFISTYGVACGYRKLPSRFINAIDERYRLLSP